MVLTSSVCFCWGGCWRSWNGCLADPFSSEVLPLALVAPALVLVLRVRALKKIKITLEIGKDLKVLKNDDYWTILSFESNPFFIRCKIMCQDSKVGGSRGFYLNFVVNCTTTLTNAATLLTVICTTFTKIQWYASSFSASRFVFQSCINWRHMNTYLDSFICCLMKPIKCTYY